MRILSLLNRCKHDYTAVDSTYTPGTGKPADGWDDQSLETRERMIRGKTVFTLRCDRCGSPQTKISSGSQAGDPGPETKEALIADEEAMERAAERIKSGADKNAEDGEEALLKMGIRVDGPNK